MANSEIRRKAKENGVHLWRIADALGITDGNFSRKLRKELAEAEKEQIFKIIDDLKKQPIRKNNLITGGGIVAVKMLSHAPATNAVNLYV